VGEANNNMRHDLAHSPVRCLPRIAVCKSGSAVELHRLDPQAGRRLIGMYLAFQPRNSFQGLPPIKDEICIKWVEDMLGNGIHVVAESRNRAGFRGSENGTAPFGERARHRTLIGHAALFPINDQKCEMLVVVCPAFQNFGIGTQLVRSCVDVADELGFQRIWLPVESTNVRARHVYRKCGFEYVSNQSGRELDMLCDVLAHRSAVMSTQLHTHLRNPATFRLPAIATPVEALQ
jgi:ribosomal protein S18 acetylase RimI-like enzyme